ncbi:MAG: hypothetical protein HXS47_00210 [Theionarchaea archaeon]|nr:hypothetical protein [Theionarchaea archaeon]
MAALSCLQTEYQTVYPSHPGGAWHILRDLFCLEAVTAQALYGACQILPPRTRIL